MFFGDVPDFEEILKVITDFQATLHRTCGED